MTARQILALARANQERCARAGIITDPWLSLAQQTEAVVALAEQVEELRVHVDGLHPRRRRMPWDRSC